MHFRRADARPFEEMPVPTVVVAMSKEGLRVTATIAALDECVREGWMHLRASGDLTPDRVTLSGDGFRALALVEEPERQD
jgi:hypothetical protein